MTDNLIQCNLAIFMLLCPSLEWMMLEIYTSPNYAHCGRHFSYAAMSTLTYFLVYEIMTLPLSPLPLEFCDEFWQWTMSRTLCVPSDSKHFALGQDPPRLSISSMVTKKSPLYLSDQSDSPSISLNPWWNRVPPPQRKKHMLGLYMYQMEEEVDHFCITYYWKFRFYLLLPHGIWTSMVQ